MIKKSVVVSVDCNWLREVPQNFIASYFAQYAFARTHFRTKRHRANTASRNASLAKHRCAYASYAAITLLHYLPSRSRTATSEFGHGLFIKTEHAFQQPTLPYTTRRCAITITTFLNNSLSRWIEIKRAVRWDYDSAMTTWVKLLLCICMFYDNKKASCAKLFCC